ncbi:MbtH protein [Streptomyces sp. 840.1]|uniref:MbtH family protein n=1 Tax=Streptomyces sp. 840.1 TaxID=2485152 RepID=UPI000F463C84|nr:MbtH family NRPS accessory protein [Streptomyces sp. 840.1]ROQ69502.1 MbtH protein [Streptomyces sp. 840.1]
MSNVERDYHVVVNAEQQYSIWLADRDIPAGWSEAGFSGPKDACLEHISEVWTDMRPLSLRARTEAREVSRETSP